MGGVSLGDGSFDDFSLIILSQYLKISKKFGTQVSLLISPWVISPWEGIWMGGSPRENAELSGETLIMNLSPPSALIKLRTISRCNDLWVYSQPPDT